jgi:hypothetical protein
MADSVRAALRERLRLQTVLVWVGFLAFVFWAFDESVVQLGMTLGSILVFGLLEILADVYDLRSVVESLSQGLFMLFGAVALFVVEGSVGISIVFSLASGWIVLDAVQTLRHKGLTNDEPEERDGHAVYHDYVVRRVHETLRERPLTRLELSVALEADDDAIDSALATLSERGVLSRNGSELHVSSPPEPGSMEHLRNEIADAFTRLAQPVTIEFESETADDTDTHRSVNTTRNDDRERESV